MALEERLISLDKRFKQWLEDSATTTPSDCRYVLVLTAEEGEVIIEGHQDLEGVKQSIETAHMDTCCGNPWTPEALFDLTLNVPVKFHTKFDVVFEEVK